jgi:hypothetical protein
VRWTLLVLCVVSSGDWKVWCRWRCGGEVHVVNGDYRLSTSSPSPSSSPLISPPQPHKPNSIPPRSAQRTTYTQDGTADAQSKPTYHYTAQAQVPTIDNKNSSAYLLDMSGRRHDAVMRCKGGGRHNLG